MRRDAIVIVDYDPAWPAAFERERARLEELLAPFLVRPIEHIGSTSIPAMAAKAIVDMLAVVRDIDEVPPVIALDGWVAAPEPGDEQRRKRSFCAPDVAHRTHHLHVVEERSGEWRDVLAFRDHLRAHPGLAVAYAALKRELAAAHGGDPNQRDGYRNGKAAFVDEVTGMALTGPVLLRDATVADARAIAEVHVASWRVAYRGIFPDDYLDRLVPDDRLPAWEEWLADARPPEKQAIVAVVGGRVGGFVTFFPSEIGALYVDPSACGRGLGSALLAAAVDRSGGSDVVLWVHPENVRARRFYERRGWVDDGADRTVDVWGLEVRDRRYRLEIGRGCPERPGHLAQVSAERSGQVERHVDHVAVVD